VSPSRSSRLRSLLVALVAAGLFLPLAVEAQQGRPGPTRSSQADRFDPRIPEEASSNEARVFEATLRAIRDFALTSHADSVLWEKAIDGLIQGLDDPYATVLTPDEVRAFQEESTGNYAGIGVQITELNEAVTITAVFRNTPADRAGLQVGDRIVGVNEDRANGWTVEDASSRIRGEPGSTVRVLVSRDGISTPIPHDIRREQVHIPAVTSERIFDDLGYILLDRVARNSAAEVDSVLKEMDGSRGLILDLRRNPGGYLDESLTLADLFLDRGSVLVTTRSRNPGNSAAVSEESAYARRAAQVPGVPLIVLVDRFSASASEIVAGALQDHDRALVIGERTFGKGSVQSVLPLPAGRLIRLTSGEWYTPQGRSLNRPRDREGRVIESDEVPEFTSRAGRKLLGGGGVFPDVEIANDTLSTREQGLISASVEAEIPLTLRIQEAAFEAAQAVRQSGNLDAELPEAAFTGFRDALLQSGLPASALNEETEAYLRWRLEVAFFQRLDRTDRSLEVQARRDPVLAEAVRLLRESTDQADLFARAGHPLPDALPGSIRNRAGSRK
jgi:carboxyl-terminal processing protease